MHLNHFAVRSVLISVVICFHPEEGHSPDLFIFLAGFRALEAIRITTLLKTKLESKSQIPFRKK